MNEEFIKQARTLYVVNEHEFIFQAVEKFYLKKCPACDSKSIANKIIVGIKFDRTKWNHESYIVPQFFSELEFEIFSRSPKKLKTKLSREIVNIEDFRFSEFKSSCKNCMYNFFAKSYTKEYSEYSVNDTMFFNHLTKRMVYFLGNSEDPDKEHFVENISLQQALEIYDSTKLLC